MAAPLQMTVAITFYLEFSATMLTFKLWNIVFSTNMFNDPLSGWRDVFTLFTEQFTVFVIVFFSCDYSILGVLFAGTLLGGVCSNGARL